MEKGLNNMEQKLCTLAVCTLVIFEFRRLGHV